MRRLGRWLRPLPGLVVLAALAWWVGPGAFVAAFRLVDARAGAAALAIGALTTWLSAGRWCLVARRLGLPLRLPEAASDYYRATFLNATLPVGVLGDADRAIRHGRRTGEFGRAVRAVVLERVGGQVVLVAAAVVAVAVVPSAVVAGANGLAVGLAVSGGLVVGAVAVVGFAARRWPRARSALADVRRVWARDTWPPVLLLSAGALVGHLSLFVVAARTAGASAPVADLLPLLVLALLAMGLPVSVGGFGPREAFTAVAFGAAGWGAASGLTVAVTYGVLALVASLPGAVVLVVGFCAGRPAQRSAPAPEPAGAGWVDQQRTVVA